MMSFISSIRKRNQDNHAITNSTQSGYFLMISLLLITIIVLMIGINAGYAFLENSVQSMVTKNQPETNGLVTHFINMKPIAEKINKVTEYIKLVEKNFSEAVKFKTVQIVPFIIATVFALVLTPSTFKKSLNANRMIAKSNAIVNIIKNFVSSIFMILLLLTNIVVPMLGANVFIILIIQLISNLILVLIIYYLNITGKKHLKSMALSSVISSVAIVVAFYLSKLFTMLISFGSGTSQTIIYFVLFIISLAIVPYIIITSNEAGEIILNKH